ncbi:MAG TPA: hypothetical protein VG148_08875 [Pyrinomonadaceae bacterium]|nr:hypothetical protein [Pyrinomonadaceae bacterium]
MRNTVTFFLCTLIISSARASAQPGPKRDGGLQTVIGRYSARTIRALNKGDGEGHVLYEKRTFSRDVDHDGDLDAVVELVFCESRRCNPATQTSNIAVFLKSKRGYGLAAGISFLKFNEDNSTEMVGRIESIKHGKIFVAVYGCEVDDETCLPKYLYRAIYSYKRGGLVRERAYARGS